MIGAFIAADFAERRNRGHSPSGKPLQSELADPARNGAAMAPKARESAQPGFFLSRWLA